jgi:hypothetical protein
MQSRFQAGKPTPSFPPKACGNDGVGRQGNVNENTFRLVNPRRLRILKLKPMGINSASTTGKGFTAGKEFRISSGTFKTQGDLLNAYNKQT